MRVVRTPKSVVSIPRCHDIYPRVHGNVSLLAEPGTILSILWTGSTRIKVRIPSPKYPSNAYCNRTKQTATIALHGREKALKFVDFNDLFLSGLKGVLLLPNGER